MKRLYHLLKDEKKKPKECNLLCGYILYKSRSLLELLNLLNSLTSLQEVANPLSNHF